MKYRFPACKICEDGVGKLRYRLRQANVWVCASCGMHYTDYLDPPEENETPEGSGALTPAHCEFVEEQLHHNVERCLLHVELIRERMDLEGLRVLDVGCGAGLFLSLMQDRGANVFGIDMNDAWIEYARAKYGIVVSKRPVDDADWIENHGESFDLITIRDVIEHVNFPLELLRSATRLLRPGGLLLIDTPCRDAVFHRIGGVTYRASRGRFPTFLNSMDFNTVLGHKQILSTTDVRTLFERVGVSVTELRKIHELSMPHEAYLKKMLRSGSLARLLGPVARTLFRVLKVRNKMLVIGEKRSGPI